MYLPDKLVNTLPVLGELPMPSLIIPTITAAIVVTLVIVVVRRTLVVVTVTGPSMAPTLADGDRVLVVRRWARRVRRGDIVAARRGDIVAARRGDIAAARRGDIAAARSDWI